MMHEPICTFYMHALLFITKKGGALHVEHAVDPQNARITFCNTQQQHQMHNQHIAIFVAANGQSKAYNCIALDRGERGLMTPSPFYLNANFGFYYTCLKMVSSTLKQKCSFY